MRSMRIAFAGASGTGKSTLATYLSEKHGLPINPVGSRSVSQAMGFASPYDVDAAGRRAEFQRRLVTEKVAWEAGHESFVSDRTTCDNLAYTLMHDVHVIDERLLGDVVAGLGRYTHVVYCPVDAFCNLAGDPSRVADMTYHRIYDVVIEGLLKRYLPPSTIFGTIYATDADQRRSWLDTFIALGDVRDWPPGI